MKKQEKLYAWQRECLDIWETNGRRGIVNVVTGAGKTRMALEVIRRVREEIPQICIRVVVPTIPLAQQWLVALQHEAPDEKWRPGLFGGDRRDDPDRQVMIYVINSAREHLSGHIRKKLAIKNPVLLICDECHHYQSRQNRRIFEFLKEDLPEGAGFFSLGLSATPFGTGDDGVLIRALGKEIYRYSFARGAEEGVIAPFLVCEIAASFLPEEMKAYRELSDRIAVVRHRLLWMYPHLQDLPGSRFIKAVMAIAKKADMDPEDPAAAFLILAYQRKEITNLAQARSRCCLSLLGTMRKPGRVLIFCERIRQAEELKEQLRQKYGHGCGLYHSEMSKEARGRVLREFREGRIRILVTCRCLDEGIDVPDADVGIVLSSSAMERQRIQRLGRILRRADGKTAARLYYIYIRESADDASYLSGIEESKVACLRYYSAEAVFSNDVYEYAAWEMLKQALEQGFTEKQQAELRCCLNEGLTGTDYLLPDKVLKEKCSAAESVHDWNYWRIMRKMAGKYSS